MFRAQGLGFRVQGLGLRAFRIQGLGFECSMFAKSASLGHGLRLRGSAGDR